MSFKILIMSIWAISVLVMLYMIYRELKIYFKSKKEDAKKKSSKKQLDDYTARVLFMNDKDLYFHVKELNCTSDDLAAVELKTRGIKMEKPCPKCKSVCRYCNYTGFVPTFTK